MYLENLYVHNMVSEINYICVTIQVNMVKEKTEYFRAAP